MVSKRELEERIASLEEEVYELKADRINDHKYFSECFDNRYKNIETLVQKYVHEHIWYTTQDNLEAFRKGEKLKVIMRDVNKIMGGDDA